MTSLGSPHFQTPLALYASLITRLRAIRQARALKRRRDDRRRELTHPEAGLEKGLRNKKINAQERGHGHA